MIYHAGSTAVVGIYAKPTVDFLIEVRRLEDVDSRNAWMQSLGFTVVAVIWPYTTFHGDSQ